MVQGASLYFDNNHMTYEGSVRLHDLFIPFMSGSGATTIAAARP
jgi:hypothetical protein